MIQSIFVAVAVSVILGAGTLAFKNPAQYDKVVSLVCRCAIAGMCLYGAFIYGLRMGAAAIKKASNPDSFSEMSVLPFHPLMPVAVLGGCMIAAFLIDMIKDYITSK
ncbi:hypothetical protein NN6n1_12910 [Shinella zoogloeoides]